MTRPNNNISRLVEAKIGHLRRKWKIYQSVTFILFGSGVLIFSATLAGSIEGILWMPRGLRISLDFVLSVICGYFFIRGFYYVFSILAGVRRPSDLNIAEWISDTVPEVRDTMRNALQLKRDRKTGERGVSVDLIEEAFVDAGQVFLKTDTSRVIDKTNFQKSYKFTAITTILLFLFLIPPVQDGIIRLANPLTHYTKPLPFSIEIEPGDVRLVEGDTLELKALIQGILPVEITFHLFRGLEELEGSGDMYIVKKDRDESFGITIPNVSASFKYKATSGRVESPMYEVTVRKPPLIRKLKIELIPPGYSQLPKINLDDNVGDILALAGSKVNFNLESRGEIDAALIIWESTAAKKDTVVLNTRENAAHGSMKVYHPGSYRIRLQAPDGLMNRFPIDYRVDILTDLPPVVDIVQPGMDLELGMTGSLKLLVEAEDDFGIDRIKLYHSLISEFSSDTAREFSEVNLRLRKDADGIFRSEYLWDLNKIGMIPGDRVEYFVRAWDNDNISGSKTAESPVYMLRMPTMEEIFEDVVEIENEGIDELEQAMEQAHQVKEKIDEAIDEIKRKGEMDWSKKRELQEEMKAQEDLLKKLEDVRDTIDEMMSKAEESSLMSLELLEKYSELQKLMTDYATPEMKKAMEQMSKALEEANPEQLMQAAEMFQQNQEELLRQIDKSLEIMKQLKMERQLEELAQRAEEMAERQEDVGERLEDTKENELSELSLEEQRLKSDMEDWLQTMEETLELAAERDSITANELDNIQQQSEQIPEEMEQTAGQIMNNMPRQVQQNAQKISQKLRAMSGELSRIKQDAVQRQKDELAEEMYNAVRDILSLSEQQEMLKNESVEISTASPGFKEMASQQAGIAEGLEKVSNNLFELSQKSFFITPEIGANLGNAASMMNSALDSYTSRNPRAVTPQQMGAIESLNRASMSVMDALAKMQGSESGTGFSELMERLEELSKQQAGLNQGTQSMARPVPGQSGMPDPNSEMMGRLAAQQRALQQAMQEAAQMAEQMGGVMGDLGNIADAMGESADSLRDRHVGERTIKLQERILSRLLDAQKSVRTQRISKKRQSKTGEDFARRSPDELREDTLEEMYRRDLLRAMKEGYSPDYQKLIQEYFKALYEKRNRDSGVIE